MSVQQILHKIDERKQHIRLHKTTLTTLRACGDDNKYPPYVLDILDTLLDIAADYVDDEYQKFYEYLREPDQFKIPK